MLQLWISFTRFLQPCNFHFSTLAKEAGKEKVLIDFLFFFPKWALANFLLFSTVTAQKDMLIFIAEVDRY